MKEFHQFDGKYYTNWASRAKGRMLSNGRLWLWGYVSDAKSTAGKGQEDKEEEALGLLLECIKPELACLFELYTTARELWERLRCKYLDSSPQAVADYKAKIASTKLENYETTEEYCNALIIQFAHLAAVGKAMPDDEQVIAITAGLPRGMNWDLFRNSVMASSPDDPEETMRSLKRIEYQSAKAMESHLVKRPPRCRLCPGGFHWCSNCPSKNVPCAAKQITCGPDAPKIKTSHSGSLTVALRTHSPHQKRTLATIGQPLDT